MAKTAPLPVISERYGDGRPIQQTNKICCNRYPVAASLDSYGAFKSTEMVKDALRALDTALGNNLAHPAFSPLGEITVLRKEVKTWANAMAIDQPSRQERAAMRESLLGTCAKEEVKHTVATVAAIVKLRRGDTDLGGIRSQMCHGCHRLGRNEALTHVYASLAAKAAAL
jgi:hypothetical protein